MLNLALQGFLINSDDPQGMIYMHERCPILSSFPRLWFMDASNKPKIKVVWTQKHLLAQKIHIKTAVVSKGIK